MTNIRVKENEPFDVALRRFKRTIEKLGTDRKFNRMRPSMARVLGLETRSAKEG